ncbi:MAG: WD40 repeat domain-containing protein [Verrucomicrobiaceae bacterium]|nr:MAG: WD40 repeat domain-containing protein [Verrucomicrobiaceae bacterium]
MKRNWTRGEKLLWATPLLFGVIAFGISQGPNIVRDALGLPRVLVTKDKHRVSSMVLSQDGSVLAAGGESDDNVRDPESGTVYFWDARTLAPLKPLKGKLWKRPTGGIWGDLADGLSLSPDGKLVGVSDRGKGGYAVYEVQSQRELWRTPTEGLTAEFSPDGRLILLNGGQLYDAKTGKAVAGGTSMGDGGFVPGRFAPDGKTVALIGPEKKIAPTITKFVTPRKPNGRSIELHWVSDGKRLRVLEDSQETNSIAFSPDGSKIVSLATGIMNNGEINGSIVRCHSSTGQLLWQQSYRKWNGKRDQYSLFSDAKFSPDGTRIAVGVTSAFTQKAPILLLDAADGREIKTMAPVKGHNDNLMTPPALAFSANGQRIFKRGNRGIVVWDLE